MYLRDKTLRDNSRTLINLQRSEIESLFPEHFKEQYPNLITLFEKYYEWLEQEGNFGDQINKLYKNRDVTQVADDLLAFIEDELLLGQAYFGGFINKREAAKFSNVLYRSKGTKYSIQQFFRAFFGSDPEVVYPKDQVFVVGQSEIGAESLNFITDDKLYQTLSILIKTDIPLSKWKDVYKLFVHPAGMYLGGQIQLVSINAGLSTLMPEVTAGELAFTKEVETVAVSVLSEAQPSPVLTGLVNDGEGGTFRTDLRATISNMQDLSIEEFDAKYSSIQESLSPSVPTFDDDSDAQGAAFRFDDSDILQTFDGSWHDSIGVL